MLFIAQVKLWKQRIPLNHQRQKLTIPFNNQIILHHWLSDFFRWLFAIMIVIQSPRFMKAISHSQNKKSCQAALPHNCIFSMIVAMPIPPAIHNVTAPYFLPVRSSSCTNFVKSIAPVAPIGCPIAIAPPFGFTFL